MPNIEDTVVAHTKNIADHYKQLSVRNQTTKNRETEPTF